MASKKATKRKFSAKQIAAQRRFAQMARTRAKVQRVAKKNNPVSLTDPQIVVLRAMKRINPRSVTTGALVSIREILKAVSYPHYGTKRIILQLAYKGVLALHEHDWPSSLTREERKMMITEKGPSGRRVYYIGAAVRDPKSLPRVVTENPTVIKAKQARRTVIRRKVTNPSSFSDQEITVLRAAEHVSRGFQHGAPALIAETLRAVTFPQYKTKQILFSLAKRGILALQFHAHPSILSRAERKEAIYIPEAVKGHVSAYAIAFSLRDPASISRDIFGSSNPKHKPNRTVIKAKKATVIVRNKAGLSESDIAKLPEAAQRQIRAQLGAIERAEEKAKTPKQREVARRRRRSLLARLGTRLRLIGQTKKFKVEARDLGRCKRKTVKIRGRHETDALAKAQSQLGRGYDQYRVKNSGASKVKQIRRDFSGRAPRGVTELTAPEGTPRDLAKLGTIVSIKTTRGRMRFDRSRKNPSGETWLCADARGRMHLASTRPRLTDEPARNFGRVLEIEYLERKPHLGYKKKTLFFHKMGEEGGQKPELISDGRGGLKFRGGDYYLSPEGIRN